MSTAVKITRDTLSPAIRLAASRLSDTRPLVEAMCLAVLSLAQRSFSNSALRAAAWPALADGSAARLRRSGQLWKGLHVSGVSARVGYVRVNAIYGAVHQLGGKAGVNRSVRIPARPFLPFQPNGEPTALAATAIRRAVETKIASLTGGAISSR